MSKVTLDRLPTLFPKATQAAAVTAMKAMMKMMMNLPFHLIHAIPA